MTEINENLENNNSEEIVENENITNTILNDNSEESSDPENLEDYTIPEPETPQNPWENAPNDTVYYEKIYDDGHLGSFTESAELAYKFGWFNNRISINDIQKSDINGWTYRKEVCPMKTDIAKLQEAKEAKHKVLKEARDNLRYTEYAHYDNDDFQIRPEDQDNINTFYSSAIAMQLGAIPESQFGLMSETNTLHVFTATQIIEIMAVMKTKVEEIYQRYWYARDVLLENASTIEEVNSIVIPASVPSNE